MPKLSNSRFPGKVATLYIIIFEAKMPVKAIKIQLDLMDKAKIYKALPTLTLAFYYFNTFKKLINLRFQIHFHKCLLAGIKGIGGVHLDFYNLILF